MMRNMCYIKFENISLQCAIKQIPLKASRVPGYGVNQRMDSVYHHDDDDDDNDYGNGGGDDNNNEDNVNDDDDKCAHNVDEDIKWIYEHFSVIIMIIRII